MTGVGTTQMLLAKALEQDKSHIHPPNKEKKKRDDDEKGGDGSGGMSGAMS